MVGLSCPFGFITATPRALAECNIHHITVELLDGFGELVDRAVMGTGLAAWGEVEGAGDFTAIGIFEGGGLHHRASRQRAPANQSALSMSSTATPLVASSFTISTSSIDFVRSI